MLVLSTTQVLKEKAKGKETKEKEEKETREEIPEEKREEPLEDEKAEAAVEKPQKKFEFIEDIPGVGPATAEKLREMGFHTVESLATATIKELTLAGVGEKQAAKVVQRRGTALRSASSERTN